MRYILIFTICFFCSSVKGQDKSLKDSSQLREVVVTAYFSTQPILRSPASVSVVGAPLLRSQPPGTLLPAINTIPGVRMEERSPGSYRLSIRGSLLRSPFGIRNVKVYLDDFLLTDAGGNTYLNLLDASSISRVEVLKGPDGSIFGANSGGVVLLSSKSDIPNGLEINGGLSGGSFGAINQNAGAQFASKGFEMNVKQAYQRSDGYRENSEINRKSIQLMPKWKYSSTAELSSLILLSDLQYKTPGGLTKAQSLENPRASRPTTNVSPGSMEQKAAIYNKTFLAGVSHSKSFGERLKHVVSITGASTDFENPFITTYEFRKEKSLGVRTYLEYTSKENSSNPWNWQYGLEAQHTSSRKKNYDNIKGEIGDKQDFVDFTGSQSFLFSRFSGRITERLSTEFALSLNFNKYSFEAIYPLASATQQEKLKSQLMPRLALTYAALRNLVFRASASRGYSAPTLEEIRPSSQIVNTSLQPEAGWNVETGLRIAFLNNRAYLDAVVFNYQLKNAIVRRVDAADTEFFVNAGSTKQRGFEAELQTWLVPVKTSGSVRGWRLNESYTYSGFKFDTYIVASNNFSGNHLTGVPRHTLVNSTELFLPWNTSIYVQHMFVSSIPLNDANTAWSAKYNLLQAKINYTLPVKSQNLSFFAGADNLLSAKYSLGDDLNAYGARYFNPAPSVNFYGGIRFYFTRFNT